MHEEIVKTIDSLRQEIDRAHGEYQRDLEQNRWMHKNGDEDQANAIAKHRTRLGNRLSNADELIGTAAEVLFDLQPTGELKPVNDPVRLHLIQADLLRLPVEQRRAALLGAINNGDAATFGAIVSAPTALGLLASDVIAQGRDAWSQKYNPHVSAPYAELRDALDRLRGAVNRERAVLGTN